MDVVTDDRAALRGLALAVSVLADIDLEPRDHGVLLSGAVPVAVPWTVVRDVVGSADPEGGTARRRLRDWLRLRSLVASLGGDAASVLRQAARAVAMAPDHAMHPGAGWSCEAVLGGALHAGTGVVGVLDDPDEVVPLPPGVAAATGVDPSDWWPELREHAEGMGSLAVQRLRRDSDRHQQVLRPVGGVDVPSLLLSPALRRHLADGDGSGMRAVAVPMRSRGWFDLARIDPAFVGAAWSATAEHERGLARPLLVTTEEVAVAVDGADALAQALQDPADDVRWLSDVRYR